MTQKYTVIKVPLMFLKRGGGVLQRLFVLQNAGSVGSWIVLEFVLNDFSSARKSWKKTDSSWKVLEI